MKALVVGGGIGGLTAALCLLDAGIGVEVFEKSAALTEIGAGIQISPNGVKVLDRLGLKPALDAIAFRPQALEMRLGQSGVRLFSIPMRDEAERRFGAPYYHVHRADLVSLLGDAIKVRAPNAIKPGRTAHSFSQSAHGVDLTFTDGARATGDVLVGADGIHSLVRTQLFGEEAARFTGNVAWRVVVPANELASELVPPTACVWVGPGRHAVTYFLRRGELVNFVGVVERDDWQQESWTGQGSLAELAADYAGWARPIGAVIAKASQAHRWALFDRDPLPGWSVGVVTLLGDACHPMLPFLAQGAVMAIEDAWVLSRQLHNTTDIPAALQDYEAARKPRTTRVQKGARRQMGLYHKRGAFDQFTTYAPMWLAARLAPGIVHSRQDWLYGVDVTKSAQF